MCQFKQRCEIETDFIPTRIRNKIWHGAVPSSSQLQTALFLDGLIN